MFRLWVHTVSLAVVLKRMLEDFLNSNRTNAQGCSRSKSSAHALSESHAHARSSLGRYDKALNQRTRLKTAKPHIDYALYAKFSC